MGDPVLDLATASMRRWACEVWRSDFDRRACSRVVLQQLFNAYSGMRKPTGWKQVRGPLSSAGLEVSRIGWQWPTPFAFEDHRGELVDLFLTSPARLKEMLVAASSHSLGIKLGATTSDFEGQPVDPVSVQAFLKSKQCSPRNAALISSLFCRAWHASDDLRRMGYGVPLACELCGEPDSVLHRFWHCTHPPLLPSGRDGRMK